MTQVVPCTETKELICNDSIRFFKKFPQNMSNSTILGKEIGITERIAAS